MAKKRALHLPVVALVLGLGATSTAFAAKPVPRPSREDLEARSARADVVGLVLVCSGAKADLSRELLAAARREGRAAPQVGLLRAEGKLAVLYPQEELTLGRWLSFAAALTRLAGVERGYVFVHPGPSFRREDGELEQEAYWELASGAVLRTIRQRYRDDPKYLAFLRRKLPADELALHRWRGYPLSELARALGIPGRSWFERPEGLLPLAEAGWPKDVGDNLQLWPVYLDERILAEMRQRAELRGASVSRVLQDVVEKEGDALAKLAEGRQEDEGRQRVVRRELAWFLKVDLALRLDRIAEEGAVSASRILERAWRSAHPSRRESPPAAPDAGAADEEADRE